MMKVSETVVLDCKECMMSERQKIKVGQLFQVGGEYPDDGHTLYLAKKDFDMKEVSETLYHSTIEDRKLPDIFVWRDVVEDHLTREGLAEKFKVVEFRLESLYFGVDTTKAENDAKFKRVLEDTFDAQNE